MSAQVVPERWFPSKHGNQGTTPISTDAALASGRAVRDVPEFEQFPRSGTGVAFDDAHLSAIVKVLAACTDMQREVLGLLDWLDGLDADALAIVMHCPVLTVRQVLDDLQRAGLVVLVWPPPGSPRIRPWVALAPGLRASEVST